MVVADGQGIPVSLRLASASPAEVTLLEPTLDAMKVTPHDKRCKDRQPKRLIADRAYDSDPHRERLAERGIALVCPHRKNRKRPATQDGRPLRRYRRRWKIERTIAWFNNFRRLVVRWERDINVYRAFFHLACVLITMRQF
jgi:transposase